MLSVAKAETITNPAWLSVISDYHARAFFSSSFPLKQWFLISMDMFFHWEAGRPCSLLPESAERFSQVSLGWLWALIQRQVSNGSGGFNFILLVLFFPKLYLHQSLNPSEFNKHILMFFCQKELKTRPTRAAVSFFCPAERGSWKSALDLTKMGRIRTLTSPLASSPRSELRGQNLTPIPLACRTPGRSSQNHPWGVTLLPILTHYSLLCPIC